MSNLLVIDVFESYYEGRKTPFPAEGAQAPAQARRDERKDAKADRPVKEAA